MQAKMTDIESLRFNLENLKKLHIDLEKQMIKFDEIIPFERQFTAKIFSPRLLNMMLACGPQIESVVKLIAERCDIAINENDEECNGKTKPVSVPKLIRKINENTVLSKFEIISKNHKLLFTPFTLHLEWWNSYNGLKHGLVTNQFQITYMVVMDSLAALSALYCLADKIMGALDENVPRILDSKNWVDPITIPEIEDRFARKIKRPANWESLLFMINRTYRNY